MKSIDMRLWPCRCCGKHTINATFLVLLNRLDAALKEIGWKLRANSGYRCEQHNKNIGGVKNSRHKTGQAVDLSVVSPEFVTPKMLADFIDEKLGMPYRGGLGVYTWGVHVDIGHMSRWEGK
jgi:uncharacterized protein YcbK (DUF882 family)